MIYPPWRWKVAVRRKVAATAYFQDAIGALEDPNRIEETDDRFDYGEDRDIVIGMSRGGLLFVVATYRDENTRRIISARKATKHEKDRYHAGDREIW